MLIYLLRHAEAEPAVSSDEARVLTPRGLEQATVAGEFCRRHAIRPELIVTSPYRRTVQTGAVVAAAIGDVPAQAAAFLGSGMLPATAFAELPVYQRLESVLLVGHQPDLGLLAATALGAGYAAGLPFSLATLACLNVNRFAPGGAGLEFFLPLKLLRRA